MRFNDVRDLQKGKEVVICSDRMAYVIDGWEEEVDLCLLPYRCIGSVQSCK